MKSLKGQFLIAAASLADPNFSRSVVLIVQHDDGGALGVVVNRPLDVPVRAVCEQVLEVDCDLDAVLHDGGPCEKILLVLYPVEGDDDANSNSEGDGGEGNPVVVPGLRFTSDKRTIERLFRQASTDTNGGGMKLIVGYSGWSAGQLEGEMRTGSWLTVPATAGRALGPAEPLWGRLVTEANLGRFVDPKWIPDDPSVN